MTEAKQGRLPYIKPLNAIRGISALMVVIFHTHRLKFFPDLDLSCFSNGYFAVDMFFILSGFVIMHVYNGQFERVNPKNYYSFMVSRFARIYPVHFAMLAILFFMELGKKFILHAPAFGAYKSIPTLITSLLMVQAWHIHPINAWNGVAWSISAEWFCYFLAPFIILFWDKFKSFVLGVFLFFVPALFLVLYTQSLHKLELTCEAGVLRMLVEFLMGVTLYGAYSDLISKHLNRPLVEGLAWISTILLLGSYLLNIPPIGIIYLCGAVILFSSLSKGVFSKLMSNSILFYLGEISYSMYLVHGVLYYNIFDHIVAKLPHQTPVLSFFSFLLLLGITITSAALSYHCIEKPAREWIRSRLSPKKKRVETPVVPLTLQVSD